MLNEDIQDDQDPVLQSVEIHRTRIIAIIDKLIEKIELSVCLDDILPWIELEKLSVFSKRSLMQINRLYSFSKERSAKYLTNSTLSAGNKSASMYLSSSVMGGQDRDTLLINTNIIAKLHHSGVLGAAMRDNFIRKQPPTIQILILHMHNLRSYIYNMVKNTETQETRYKKHLSEAWLSNMDTKEKLISMRDICNNKNKATMNSITDKKSFIKNLKDEINTLHESRKGQCERIVIKSENKMKQKVQISDENQDKLLNEASNLIRDYQALLITNLAKEKKSRTKRFKVETVLAQWLASYDSDIGDLQKELEKVEDGYNEIKNKYDKLKVEFETQTIQYNELMEEKKAEERRIFEMKLYHIVATRSARIIQRWWRKIYNKKYKKAKGKKGKKKK